MKNVALVSAREIADKQVVVNGVTASPPKYIEVDPAGNKEWVVDVYIGPLVDVSILRNVPIVPAAKQNVTDIRQPVQLERSKQGKYTVVGRAKVMSAGVQTPDGTILEPQFREVEVNMAQLDILHVADLDYTAEMLQADEDPDTGTQLQADEDEPLQLITALDAFGHPVGTEDDDCSNPELVSLTPVTQGKTRHVRIDMATLGLYGDPEAMQWGDPDSELQPAIQIVEELED